MIHSPQLSLFHIKFPVKIIEILIRSQVNMDVRKESHVAAALKYIEENLPVGEDGLYGLVNNAGVRQHVGDVVVVVVHRDAIVVVVVIVRDVTVVVINFGVVACGPVGGDSSPWSTLLG